MSTSKSKSWREQRVPIHGGSDATVYFNDTTPNHVIISNSSNAPIYVGTNGNVNSQNYDVVVPAYGTRIHASMIPFNRLYLFNGGIDSTSVTLKSYEDEFNAAAVAQSVEMVGVGQNGLLGIVDINNLLSPLPAGNNMIGGMVIAGYEQPLPTGNNNIGRIAVDSLPNHAASKLKISGAANENKVVKISGGVVYQVQTTLTDAALYDGPVQAWSEGNFKSDVGLKCDTDIRIKFGATAGDVYILFH